MRREIQTVAVPVFQFGIYSENDLSFFAGPDFDFGGRVHSNANVYLAQDGSATLTIRDVLTAVGEVVRTHLANGLPISTSGHRGYVTRGHDRRNHADVPPPELRRDGRQLRRRHAGRQRHGGQRAPERSADGGRDSDDGPGGGKHPERSHVGQRVHRHSIRTGSATGRPVRAGSTCPWSATVRRPST